MEWVGIIGERGVEKIKKIGNILKELLFNLASHYSSDRW